MHAGTRLRQLDCPGHDGVADLPPLGGEQETPKAATGDRVTGLGTRADTREEIRHGTSSPPTVTSAAMSTEPASPARLSLSLRFRHQWSGI